MDASRRDVLKIAAALLVEQWAAARGLAQQSAGTAAAQRKVIVVTCGGMRREDTFAKEGLRNIPHLSNDLFNHALFFPAMRNAGVTSHFNTLSSLLTGTWQRLDDWGLSSPTEPTIVELLRKQTKMARNQTWIITSNKAMTNRIGASTAQGYGAEFGANVIFPKQLLINAVVHAAAEGRAVHSPDRSTVQPEIEKMLNRENYDGLGWSVGETAALDPITLGAVQQAIDDLVRTSAPATGDEFTFLVSAEVMRRFAPAFLTITFSDMEVAHFGSYSLHLSGIRTVDRLVAELWTLIESLPEYRGKTTLLVLPEFGRDMDGSTTNGFFNHRQNSESTRLTWMLCLGDAVRRPQVIEDPVEQIQLCATLGKLFEIATPAGVGRPLPGLWL
ncbi:hypothetical protein ACOBR2_02330 [Telmatobacter bradus]|uniref:hypothetical protein n=1 Tax=Telmatobacter bradus TaxID=474953 RepID=UPI003B430321